MAFTQTASILTKPASLEHKSDATRLRRSPGPQPLGNYVVVDRQQIFEKLMDRGELVKDTHGSTIRIAPPPVISKEDLDWRLDQLRAVLGVR